jgi:hypothetical protein
LADLRPLGRPSITPSAFLDANFASRWIEFSRARVSSSIQPRRGVIFVIIPIKTNLCPVGAINFDLTP